MIARFEYIPNDCWVGVFWKKTMEGRIQYAPEECWWVRWDVWLCLVPMLPLHLTWRVKKNP
jgi:hypothetical protein